MWFFEVEEDRASGYSGVVNAAHKWGLPGIICPACKSTWGTNSRAYPLPPNRPAPCQRCGRHGLSLPAIRLLDSSTVPPHLDLGITFRPLPAR